MSFDTDIMQKIVRLAKGYPKRIVHYCLVGLFVPLCLQNLAYAQINHLVHYQGAFDDKDGAIYNGEYNLTFSIYEARTSQTPLWSETHENVTISNGQYAVLLGSENPLSLTFHEYLLQVTCAETNYTGFKTAIVGPGYNYRMSFLFAAYTIVWMAIVVYLVSISRRQRNLFKALGRMEEIKKGTA